MKLEILKVTVHISGNVERFLSLTTNRRISIFNVRADGNGAFFEIRGSDYLKLSPVIRKTGIRPVIVKKKGLIFIYRALMKNPGIPIGIAVFFSLMIFFSGFIWNIRIEGNYLNSDEVYLGILKEYGVIPFTKIQNISSVKLKEDIRNRIDEVSWAGIEIKGTTLILRVKERKNNVEKPDDSIAGMPLIASHDSEVVSIVTASGTARVKAGDSVKKGDILIDGYYEVKDDTGNVMDTRKCLARGKVMLRRNVSYESDISLFYEEKYYKKVIRRPYISFRQYKINFPILFDISDGCDIMIDGYELPFGNDLLDEVSFGFIRYMEYDSELKKRDINELKKLLEEEYLKNLKKLEENGNILCDSKLEFKEYNGRLSLSGVLVLESEASEHGGKDVNTVADN